MGMLPIFRGSKVEAAPDLEYLFTKQKEPLMTEEGKQYKTKTKRKAVGSPRVQGTLFFIITTPKI